jgi:hypothetical protein
LGWESTATAADGEAAQQHQAQRKACRMTGSPDSFAHYIFFLHRSAPVAQFGEPRLSTFGGPRPVSV